jgi:hypothetical protein
VDFFNTARDSLLELPLKCIGRMANPGITEPIAADVRDQIGSDKVLT